MDMTTSLLEFESHTDILEDSVGGFKVTKTSLFGDAEADIARW